MKRLEKIVELTDIEFFEEVDAAVREYSDIVKNLKQLYNNYEMDKENYIVTPYKSKQGQLSYERKLREPIGFRG